MNKFQHSRIAELEDQLKDNHPEPTEVLAKLPEDSTARIAALATVLELDAVNALRPDIPLANLMNDRESLRRSVEATMNLFKEQGMPLREDTEAV